jgi:TonB family protein
MRHAFTFIAAAFLTASILAPILRPRDVSSPGRQVAAKPAEVFRIGDGVSAPVLIHKVEPKYSNQARKAKFSGSVLLSIVVAANGLPRDINGVRPLGLGLDEKAIEAVRKWRFRPGMKDGRAVDVFAHVSRKLAVILPNGNARVGFGYPSTFLRFRPSRLSKL